MPSSTNTESISIPLSELAKIPSLKKLIGRKKKLSKVDLNKIADSLTRIAKKTGAIKSINNVDDWLDWLENEGLNKLRIEVSTLQGQDYAKAIQPWAPYIAERLLAKVNTKKYDNYDITQMTPEYRQKLLDIHNNSNLTPVQKDKKTIKLIDEFESHKNVQRIPA